MTKQRLKISLDPETDAIINEVQTWLGEKTKSKTVVWLLKWGRGSLFGKKK